MFRHSTKQQSHSAELRRSRALRAAQNNRQILCDSVYANTYEVELPEQSVRILENIICPLTGGASTPCASRRKLHTVVVGDYCDNTRFRMCFAAVCPCGVPFYVPRGKENNTSSDIVSLFVIQGFSLC